MFGKKGDKIVNMNNEAVDKSLDHLVEIDYPDSWADAGLVAATAGDEPEWVTEGDEAHAGPAGRQTAGERLSPDGIFPVGHHPV
jgi:pyruvate-ferredoxin/flavodoxin oxidoreductase